jgi:membrane fusion protein (multidrug efflux system)
VNPKTRAFGVEGEVPNADMSLKPGTFARVRILTDRVDKSTVVPVSAIQTRYGTSRVFLVRDGRISGAEVELGDRLGPRVELLAGVEPGALIVAEDVEGLTDGTPVEARGEQP